MSKLLDEVGGTVLLLFLGLVFFTFVLIFVEWRFQQDAQVFQVVSNLVSGFGGALLGLMSKKADKKPDSPPPPNPPSPQ